MSGFAPVFVAVLAAGLALEWWLDARHARRVRAHRERVPAAFAGRVPLAAHRKAAEYTVARVRAAAIERGYDAVVLIAWTLGGGLAVLDRAWTGSGLGSVAAGTGLVLTVMLVQGLLDLPFDAWRTFGLEQRFGYNRTSVRVYLTDLLKQAALGTALGAPLAALVLWLMAGAGPAWWWWTWLAWLGFSLGLAWAYPNLIAPLFNRFTPLADEQLRARIGALLERQGVDSGGVWVMDGSRRSGHGNAYFAGLGRQRRVVIYDTLLEQLDGDEIEAVIAHELGHRHHRHVPVQLALGAAIALLALGLLAALIEQPWFFAGIGLPEPSLAAALVGFLLVAPRFALVLRPLTRWLARRHEFEADRFAARVTAAGVLATALVKLYRDNSSTLTPDPWYSAFHDTHPPAPLRIERLRACE